MEEEASACTSRGCSWYNGKANLNTDSLAPVEVEELEGPGWTTCRDQRRSNTISVVHHLDVLPGLEGSKLSQIFRLTVYGRPPVLYT